MEYYLVSLNVTQGHALETSGLERLLERKKKKQQLILKRSVKYVTQNEWAKLHLHVSF